MKVLGISGSLRRASFNTALLRAASELAPPGMSIEAHSIAEIPLYNEDVRVAGYPEPAQALRAAIESADALLIVTPEYNYSIPGVLKNAIDWRRARRRHRSPVSRSGSWAPLPVGSAACARSITCVRSRSPSTCCR